MDNKKITEREITEICTEYGITNYTINLDGSIDVDGNVSLRLKRLGRLPLKFNKVIGYFECSDNQLTSLEHCPSVVGGDFECSDNQLTSLKYCPSVVGGDFECPRNELTSLEHCPSIVGGNFSCHSNELTSLEHCPSEVGGNFICSDNDLTSLEHCPSKVVGNFVISESWGMVMKGNVKGNMKVSASEIIKCTTNCKSLRHGCTTAEIRTATIDYILS